jgi:hypothetical protein
VFYNKIVFHQLILKSNKALAGLNINEIENIKSLKHDIMAYEKETAKYKYDFDKHSKIVG